MKTLQTALLAVVAVFAPIHSVMIAALVLILVDMISGVIAAHKDGDSITSSGFKRSIAKIFLYELAILMAFITEHYLVGDAVPVLKLVTGFIGLTELKSILENMDRISGNKLFSTLIDKLTQTSADLKS